VINVANVVTIARVFLALVAVSLLWMRGDRFLWWSFVLTIFVIYADALDGFLARLLKQTSKFGAILDIAGDRVVEMVYWITFAVLGWIHVWVPLLFLVRGTLVDSIRAYYSEKGFTAFGDKSMMKSGLGRFLVASNFSRFSYAVAKALAFCLIIAVHISTLHIQILAHLANFFLYFACAFCVIRGLPVLIEGRDLFMASDLTN
jgi:CDP-diacylglycerol--glycerol-3-phosphate 3-phosphatidyltransferase